MNMINSVLNRIKEYAELGLNSALLDAGLGTIKVFRNSPIIPREDDRMVGIVTSPEEGAISYMDGLLTFKVSIDVVLLPSDDIEVSTNKTLLYEYADVLFAFFEDKIFDNGNSQVMSLAVFHQFDSAPPEIVLELLVAKDLIC